MRGKLCNGFSGVTAAGITPAGAGKTNKYLSIGFCVRDHPRRCGENSYRYTCKHRRRGSPPQVRGKRPLIEPPLNDSRITPAGAGKTAMLLSLKAACRDHPRRCGENVDAQTLTITTPGSPPQVRGKPFRRGRAWQRTRITPAGAGKTKMPTSAGLLARDHPRRCGENYHWCPGPRRTRGSPPQVRGKHCERG